MEKTSILVAPSCPSPETGTGQRSLLMLDALAKSGPVHVVLLDDYGPIDQLRSREGVASVKVLHSKLVMPKERHKQRLLGPMRLALPSMAYRVERDLKRRFEDHIKDVGADTVLFRYLQTFCAAGLSSRNGLDVIVDVDDRDDQKYASRLARLFGSGAGTIPVRVILNRVGSYLKRRLGETSLVIFAAEEDIWPLGNIPTLAIPNVPHDGPDTATAPLKESQVVLFVGSHSHVPNRQGVQWFIENGWPNVLKRCPDAEFRVVGVGAWSALEEQLGPRPGVTFVGRVEDLSAEYEAARVSLCPVREGGGSKIKVIEAAAYGRPVVADQHALRGYDARLAHSIAAAGSAEGMAELVADYLQDHDKSVADGSALRSAQEVGYSRTAVVDNISRAISGMSS